MIRIFAICVLLLALWLTWGPVIQKKFASPPVSADAASTKLSEVEQSYYTQVFDYTMIAIAAGQSYQWKSYSGSGTISVSALFDGTSGAKCRSFSERYLINGVEGTADGVACKRQGKDGWCRLRKADAHTCAMEPPSTLTEKVLSTSDSVLESTKGVTKGVLDKTSGILR